jgi:hypothetical protein
MQKIQDIGLGNIRRNYADFHTCFTSRPDRVELFPELETLGWGMVGFFI